METDTQQTTDEDEGIDIGELVRDTVAEFLGKDNGNGGKPPKDDGNNDDSEDFVTAIRSSVKDALSEIFVFDDDDEGDPPPAKTARRADVGDKEGIVELIRAELQKARADESHAHEHEQLRKPPTTDTGPGRRLGPLARLFKMGQ